MFKPSTAVLSRVQSIGIGVHDGLSAQLAVRARPHFLWLSSFGCSASFGIPDVGILDWESMVRLTRVVLRIGECPGLVVDMDAGYGDLPKVAFAAAEFAAAGAAAICIEDYPHQKRCSLYQHMERSLAPLEDHVKRVQAASRAMAGSGCAVVARTEALVAGQGVVEALRRAHAYVDAGANAVFVQAVSGNGYEELLEFCRAWRGRTPVLLAPTSYPDTPAAGFFAAGASHVIYANQLIRAAHRSMKSVLAGLLRGNPGEVEGAISSVKDLFTDVDATDPQVVPQVASDVR
jgi:phosphoenolpyruvate phosphomutase